MPQVFRRYLPLVAIIIFNFNGQAATAAKQKPFPLIPSSALEALQSGTGKGGLIPCLPDEHLPWVKEGTKDSDVKAGLKQLTAESWAKATIHFARAKKKNDKNTLAYSLEALSIYMTALYEKNGAPAKPVTKVNPNHLRQAIADAETAIKLQPNCALLYRNCAILYLFVNHKKSIEYDFKAINLAPKDPRCLIAAATHFVHSGLYKNADQVIKAGLAIHPDSEQLLFASATNLLCQGRFNESLPIYDKLLSRPIPIAELYYERGSALSQLGDYKRALQDLNQAIKIDPQCGEYYSTRALIKRADGHLLDAVDDLKKAISLNQKLPHFHMSLAWCYSDNHQDKEALAEADWALQLGAKHSSIYNCKALSLYRMGRLSEALKCTDQAIALDGQDDDALRMRGQICEKLGDLEQALVDYDNARKAYAKNYVRTSMRLGIANGTSIREFSSAKRLKDQANSAAALCGNGKAVNRELIKETLRTYDKLIKLNPKKAELYYERAITNMTGSDYQAALNDFESMAPLHQEGDQRASATLLESICLQRLNRQDKALAGLRSGLKTPIRSVHLKDLLEFSLGNLKENQLRAREHNEIEKTQNCYYNAMQCRQRGDKVKAIAFLRKALTAQMYEMDEFQLALTALNELAPDPGN